MFEILKVFIEQAFKLLSIESLVKQRDKNKLAAIGAELFSLYTNLSAIHFTGLQIVAEVDSILSQWERSKKTKRDWDVPTTFRLEQLLDAQRRNICWFAESFATLSQYLDVLDPTLVRVLGLFLSSKRNIIGMMLGEFQAGNQSAYSTDKGQHERVPLLFSASFEADLLKAVQEAESWPPERSDDPFFVNTRLLHGFERYRSDVVSLNRLSDEQIKFLKGYLRNRKPKEQLDALQQMLEQLHKALTANFELKDVLLRIGQEPSQSRLLGVGWEPPRIRSGKDLQAD